MKRILLFFALAITSMQAINLRDIGSQVQAQVQQFSPEVQRRIQELKDRAMEQANIIRNQQTLLQQAQNPRVIDAARRELARAQETYNNIKNNLSNLGIDTRRLGLGL